MAEVGTPNWTFQKIQDDEKLLERQQKLALPESTLFKEKQKRREKPKLAEANSRAENIRQRLALDLQVKDAQVCCLREQLGSAQKQIKELAQELNRCRLEMAKLLCMAQSGESHFSLISNGCSHGSPVQVARKDLYSDMAKQSFSTNQGQKQISMMLPAFSTGQKLPCSSSHGHREPTAFPQQEEAVSIQYPSSPLPWVQDTPAKFNAELQQHSNVYRASENRKVVSPEEQLKQANKVLKWTLAVLENWVQVQDKGSQAFCRRSKDFQMQLEKTQGKLAAQGACEEHRIQQLIKELQCLRQNAEISQCNMEQRLNMKEKQLEQEAFEHQRLCQALERQHQQECSQLRQELQQARSEACLLQAQLVTHQSTEELGEALLTLEQRHQESPRENAKPGGDWQKSSIQGLAHREQRDYKSREMSDEAACSQDSHKKLRTFYYSVSSQAGCQERQQKRAASPSRESFEVQASVGFQRESELSDCEIKVRYEEATVSASVSEINVKLAGDGCNHYDIAQPKKKCQSFEMYVDVKASGPEDASAGKKGEQSSWTRMSVRENSDQNSPEHLILRDLQQKSAGLMVEKQVLQSELLDWRLKPDSAVARLDSQPKDLWENSWEQKQAADGNTGEAKDLNTQVLALEGKPSSCVMELKSMKNKEVTQQETSEALSKECLRLSESLWGKGTVVHQTGIAEQTLEKKLYQVLIRQSKILNIQDLEKPKDKKVEDTPEKPPLSESKALLFQKDQGKNQECGNVVGHQDNEIHVLCEKLLGLEEQLNTESNHHGMVSEEPEASGTQVCTEEPTQEHPSCLVEELNAQYKTLCEENVQEDERAMELQCSVGRVQATDRLQTHPLMLASETKSENIEEFLMNVENKEFPIVILNETIAKAQVDSIQEENLEIHKQQSYIPSRNNSDPHATLEEYAVLSTKNMTSENCGDSKNESSELVTALENTGYTDRKEIFAAHHKDYSSIHKVTADTGSDAELSSLQEMLVGLRDFTRQQKHPEGSEESQTYIPSRKQLTSDCQEENITAKERRDLQITLKELLEKILEVEFSAVQSTEMDVQTCAQETRVGPAAAMLSFLQQLCVMHTRVSDILEEKSWCELLEIWERWHRGEGDGGTLPNSVQNELRLQETMKPELLSQGPGEQEVESLRECNRDFSKFHVCDSRTSGSTQGKGQLQDLDLRDSDPGFQNSSEFVKSYWALKENNMALYNTLATVRRELLQLKGRTGPQKDMQHSETQTDPEETPVCLQGPSRSTEGQISKAWQWTEDPAIIVARIRRQREQMSLAYDDTEYEPYGLPEVVMKGFADIPTGPACPYVLRRGLLGSSLITKVQHVAHNDGSSGV
ncbi:centromere protein F [Microcaecilia unicolor]|uniref:Centromere protein F-like n=1 Tax=Microcaecilia unicolor TaxID=1415580 RepID=A0A6P7ZJ05_9AMPH|nr:centromere protein F-like [Microcaecilia unicolor]